MAPSGFGCQRLSPFGGASVFLRALTLPYSVYFLSNRCSGAGWRSLLLVYACCSVFQYLGLTLGCGFVYSLVLWDFGDAKCERESAARCSSVTRQCSHPGCEEL